MDLLEKRDGETTVEQSWPWPLAYSTASGSGTQGVHGKNGMLLRNTCPKGQLTGLYSQWMMKPMGEALQTGERRSQRVFHKMRLQALGRNLEGRKFREICETVVVSAHGGLLNLRHEVNNGEMLVLVHPETQEEQECRIVFLGESGERGIRVGVEFLTPAPHFWGIDFERTTGGKIPKTAN